MDVWTETTYNIPWQRLTTAYGRGTDIPQLIETGQYKALADLIEHQSTLWQVTPWVLLELLRELANRKTEPEKVSLDEIELYIAVASCFTEQDMESGQPITSMSELLDEKYLWPVDDQEDEEMWEEEEPPGYESEAFFSYYYVSYSLLKQAEPVFTAIMNGNDQLAPTLRELLLLLEEDRSEQ
ncbi:hypothetical protein BVG16_21250 [Paenibacillus selenitireducens]|uniref:Uncharacterized protein n=1 Tax=Paenibacillus selenitireducens TaxID=1324314 RepID=A0A1T2X712_9BACL|nr:hypothetical protein BVG16_21250 [Paenibacillus selenitireducens]